jgi:hypothetical protein
MSLLVRRLVAHCAAMAAAGAAWVLLHFDPATYDFYPRCPIFFWFGIYCPGCGATRALAALLHGRWLEAIHFNPLVVMVLPLVAAFSAIVYWRAVRQGEFAFPVLPEWVLRSSVAVAVMFMVVRNLA